MADDSIVHRNTELYCLYMADDSIVHGNTELYCLYMADDSIVHAISFFRRAALYQKISPPKIQLLLCADMKVKSNTSLLRLKILTAML